MRIEKRHIAIVAAAAPETSRYAINGVLVESAPFERLTATDGRQLVRWTGRKADSHSPESTILALDHIKTAIKTSKDWISLEPESTNGSASLVADTGACLTQKTLEGNFPDVDAIMPELEEFDMKQGAVVQINAVLLEKLLGTLRKMNPPKNCPDGISSVRLQLNGGNRPLRLSIVDDAGNETIGVLMPLNPTAKKKGGAL